MGLYIRRNDKGQKQKKDTNKGFSLVEVLVCVAILAIISVPVFSGLRLSASNVNRAHSTQKITAYAQEIMEKAKSTETEAFVKLMTEDASGNATGTVDRKLNLEQKNKFAAAYGEELFTVITIEKEDVEIGGKNYNMEIELDPNAYSVDKGVPPEAALDNTASNDANVFPISSVSQVNGLLFPVVSDETGSYEGKDVLPAAALYNLEGRLRENQLSGFGINEEERLLNIYNHLEKTIRLTIREAGTEKEETLGGQNYITNSLQVSCDVDYKAEYNGIVLEQTYNVFSGIYELRGKVIHEEAGVKTCEWEKGGNIYLFAKAYQDQFYVNKGASAAPAKNIIEIENGYSGSGELDIYLVRGFYTDATAYNPDGSYQRGLNFDEIYLNGTLYSKAPDASANLTGEAVCGQGIFHTNVKGVLSSRELTASDMSQTIGMERPDLRCYQVTVTITEKGAAPGDEKEVAKIISTKEIR